MDVVAASKNQLAGLSVTARGQQWPNSSADWNAMKLEDAYARVWAGLQGRVGDPAAVQDRLSRLIVAYARRHPAATATDIADAVAKMFETGSHDKPDDPP